MEENQVSVTALLTAYSRGYHAANDDPKIFDDRLAYQMFTEEERSFFGHNLVESWKFFDPERAASCPDQAAALASVMRMMTAPITLSRARYAEDSLEAAVERGVRQYVVLGAGMETFAFRRPDLMRKLHMFEVDHPATQAFKRQRLAGLGWDLPERLTFVPADFSRDSLDDALASSSYDPRLLTFFSWLGVTYYLSRDEVFAMLRSMADIAPVGSVVVFDYLDAEAFVPGRAAKRVRMMQEATNTTGEPMKTGFDPFALAADTAGLGFRLEENLSPSEIERLYFQGRADGYHAFEQVHFALAVVA